jgi:hypothetical protein
MIRGDPTSPTTTSYSDWETHPIDVTTTTTSYSDWEKHSSDNDGNIALSQNSTGNVHHALTNRMVLVEETVSPDCTTHATIMELLEADVSKGGASEEIPSDAFHQPTEEIPADAFHQPIFVQEATFSEDVDVKDSPGQQWFCFLFQHTYFRHERWNERRYFSSHLFDTFTYISKLP